MENHAQIGQLVMVITENKVVPAKVINYDPEVYLCYRLEYRGMHLFRDRESVAFQ